MRVVYIELERTFQMRERVTREACHIQMNRTRRTRRRFAESLADEVRNLLERVDARMKLRHCGIKRRVLDLLIRIAVLVRRHVLAGERDDGGMAEVRVLHPRCEIRRTHRLRHADAGLAGHARIAVRHVRHRFL
jgi:hypothetical protein